MQIEGFRAVAERANALVVVDKKSAQIKVRNNHVLNRAITWLREKISPNPLRHAATDAARNRFLQAIAYRNSGYDSADVDRARDLLADDALERRPLSSRRIREVLNDLDGRSSATTRVNRRVAAFYREATGRPATLAERDLAAGSQRERSADALSLYGDEPGAPSPDSVNGEGAPVSSSEIGPAREEVMAEARAEPPPTTSTPGADVTETLAEPPPPPASEESTAVPANPADPSPTAHAEGSAASATHQATVPDTGGTAHAEAQAGATAREVVPPKQLTRELSGAGLPREVAKPLRKLIANKEISDRDGLAKQANRRIADFVVENRVGSWYVDAIKDEGIRRMAQRGGTVHVPTSLLNKVAKSITRSPVLKAYSDIKAESRVLVAAHVQRELERGAVSQEAVIGGGSAPD